MSSKRRAYQRVAHFMLAFCIAVALGSFTIFLYAGRANTAATFAAATVAVSAFASLGFALAASDAGDSDE